VPFFNKIVKTYGNLINDFTDDRWETGIEVVKAIRRKYSKTMIFDFLNDEFHPWTLEHVKDDIFRGRVPSEWCELLISMLKLNPVRRSSAGNILTIPLLGGNGVARHVEAREDSLGSFVRKHIRAEIHDANDPTNTFGIDAK